jgi:mRNA interferase HigB
MRVIAKKVLRDFWVKYTDSEQQLKAWYKEATIAKWNSPVDVKQDHAKASIIGNNRVVFDICGSKYRLIVKINYERQWVFIRFIGTHKEYDSIDAQNK